MIFVKRIEIEGPAPEDSKEIVQQHVWSVGSNVEGSTREPYLCLVFPEEGADWSEVLVFVATQEVALEKGLKVLAVEDFYGYDKRKFKLTITPESLAKETKDNVLH